MRKNLAVFCGLVLVVFMAGSAFAANPDAFFKLDTDLVTAGYQSTSTPVVQNIGATKLVGFAVYGLGLEDVAGYAVTLEWDAAKVEFRSNSSAVSISDDEVTINGSTIVPAVDANIYGTAQNVVPETLTGKQVISVARQGAGETPAEGLLYYCVFRTLSTFTTEDLASIKVTVEISDSSLSARSLGSRFFNVNQVAVKESTWGAVKSQFDF